MISSERDKGVIWNEEGIPTKKKLLELGLEETVGRLI
jgi:hypothetical protein